MKFFLQLILFLLSFSLFSTQGLVISSIKSESIDKNSLSFIETELVSLFSQMMDIEVFRENDRSNSFRYIFSSEIVANDNLYNFNYEFVDSKSNTDILTGTISSSNINGISESLLDEITKIRAILRKPPKVEKSKYCHLVISADVPQTDIYVNGEYKGPSPVSITGTIGEEISIEGRTETQKKTQLFKIESNELTEVKLNLEVITGSLLLKGDVLGRTLHFNDKEYEIENSPLLKDLPIGKVNLSMESEWGIWSHSVFIEEEKLIEVEVNFKPISRVDITVYEGITLNISNEINSNTIELYNSEQIVLAPGEYNFISSKEGFLSNTTKLSIDPGFLYEFITPELELIPIVKEIAVKPILSKKQKIHKASFWSAISSGILLTAGIIGEITSINLYENSSVTEEVVSHRETGQNLRIANITLLSTGTISLISYFLSGDS